MAYTIKVEGIEITASTTDEALALLRALVGSEPAQKDPLKRINGSVGISSSAHAGENIDLDVAHNAANFLIAIKNSPNGAKHDTIMNALGASSPKGIGSKSAKINQLLKQIGLRKEMVYKNPKRPGQGRTWIAGRHLDRAIRMLEERIAQAENK